jgi:hypothetical protein
MKDTEFCQRDFKPQLQDASDDSKKKRKTPFLLDLYFIYT